MEELDPRFSYAAPALVKLKSMPGEKLCEYKMGLTSNLEPCDFYAKNVWYRGIADLIVLDAEKKTAKIFDYKTGKSARYADKGQLELMALCVFAHFPHVQTVKAGLLFVVCNAVIREDFSVDNTSELWKKWGAEYGQLQRAYDNGVWNPRPTGLCKAHCVVLECPHNGKR